MDTLTAARGQMALSLVFHMVFAATGIGLPLLLVIVEGAYLRTGREHYKRLAVKWAKVTGLLFAIGAVSGTALSFELGLLWPRYMEVTGAVVGHIFGLEGYAFFVEAIFIGLYLYGWDKLSPKAHWWCGVVIAFAGAVSGWFILGVNAWMQLPVGFERDLVTGAVTVTDPIAIFKQPAWVYMAVHSTLSCYIAVGFAVAGVYALGWLRGRRDAYHRSAIVVAMAVGGICALLQPFSGDLLAKFVFRTQPVKFAAMEGQFKTESRAPLRIGGWPNVEQGRTDWAIEIPGGLSILAAHDPATVVRGLNDVPRDRRPNVHITHAMFQLMVALGIFMMLLAAWFWWRWWRRRSELLGHPLLLRSLIIAAPMGFIALEAGWMVTEIGRQPWVINGIMLTRDAVTPLQSVTPVFFSFTLLYVLLGVTTIILLRAMRSDDEQAPQDVSLKSPQVQEARP